jgi:hypothetical protein
VFLSACHSESVAAAVVEAGVPHVVVVKVEHKMLDKTALDFTRAFYRNLLKGHSVSQSFRNVSAAARIHLSLSVRRQSNIHCSASHWCASTACLIAAACSTAIKSR